MKIGSFLKRAKRAGTVTVEANGGYLQIWLALAFLALVADAIHGTIQSDAAPNARIAGEAVAADKLPYRTSRELVPVGDTGAQCIETYTNLEMAVYDSLKGDSWLASNDQLTITQLTSTKMSACAVQRKVLDILARYPRDQRSEALAAMVDAVEHRH